MPCVKAEARGKEKPGVRNLLLRTTSRQLTGTRTTSQQSVWPLMVSIVIATSVCSHGSKSTSFIVVAVVVVVIVLCCGELLNERE